MPRFYEYSVFLAKKWLLMYLYVGIQLKSPIGQACDDIAVGKIEFRATPTNPVIVCAPRLQNLCVSGLA